MEPGETPSVSTNASFISGIVFGLFISGILLNLRPLLGSKFRALLGYQDSDSNNIKDEPVGKEGSRLSQEDSASLHSLDSNVSQGSSLSQQEDSTCDHPPPESKSTMTEGSSSSPRGYKYDVYLSFRGADTRKSFIDHLYHRLMEEGILAFKDDVHLDIGEIISSQLLQAIKDSRISIVVFSRGYASSTWCLDDLVAIVDCHKEMKQELLPVFYDVDPRDVRYQSGAYEDAFDSHRERFKEEPDKIYKWKSAMTYLADLSGFALRDPAEAEGIERIVEAVRDTLVYKFQISRSTHKNPESTERRPSLQESNKYDVFLSLRRTHTPYTFIYYLFHYLTKKGFSTFKSEEETERGDSIPSQDLQVIKDSRILIVVFTRDYADSTCSLEEMATIVDCHRELNQTVIPVFCGVDRRDVQRQTGPYEKAFVSYTKEFKQDPLKVQKWREALKYMTNLQDISLKDWSEIEAIGNIIQIVERLCPKFSRLSSHSPVGIQSSLAMLEKLLKLEDDCVLVLGVWGMGGSGKTTHALALYDRIVQEFEGACFIEDVSQVYRFGGATALQKQVLCQFLNEELSDMYSPFEMSGFLRRRLYGKKILIVLENVDVPRQLESLAINRNMLGNGSRIIITTRDRHILTAYGVDEIYEIPLLNEDEARELFLSACPDVTNDEGYTELIPRVLEYAGGLPLAIRVLASFLRYRNVTFWEDTLNRSRRVPSFEIIKILQISFNGLDQEEKEIFLHIACFFHGKKLDFVKEVLNCCGYFAGIGIHALIDKSLIKNEEEEIHMHDLLQEMGKEIVRQECLGNPVSWSRLWRYEDFSFTLKSKNEASEVKAIVLYEDISISKHEDLNIEGLSKMTNLKMLILFHEHFSGKLTSLPNKLRYLLWDGYPFSSLPSFEPYNSLVQLNLPNSRIKRLWHGRQIFPSLERVDLSYSKELMETPNFEGSPSLKRLDFRGCTNLVRVDSSIGLLKELAYLSFRNCCRLVILDLDVGCNYDCKKPETKPDFTGVGLPNLEHLDLGECTSLSTVHYSIGTLKLKFLNLQGCINLVEKPDFSVFLRDEPENEVIDHSQVGIRSNLAVLENPGSSQRLSQEYSASDLAPQKSKSIMTEGSSSSPRAYKYDVYLSFRGADTRKSFIDHLYHRLMEEGVFAFKDDVHLDRGESISSEPLQAIKGSRISIVVFSKGYASSTWCLDDLVAIVDCHKEMKRELLPVFYDVDPCDVRYQIGAYEDAFDSHRERFKEEPDKIYKWKSAMTYLTDLRGLILRDRAEAEGIERIVEAVRDTLVYKFQISRSTHKNPESTERRPSLQESNKYDVFLSLRRTHTPYTFIDYLYHYLTKKGFSTFKSEKETERGDSIPSQDLQVIKDSRILIVVFTRDYADSTCSLEEMATIVDCHWELNQTVIPVFCDVHPRDVRRQTGPYEKAFVSYTKEFKQHPLKVQKWREALKYMTNLQGQRLKRLEISFRQWNDYALNSRGLVATVQLVYNPV
nr:probable WRKY transcription factor 19 [Arachis hypogaea]